MLVFLFLVPVLAKIEVCQSLIYRNVQEINLDNYEILHCDGKRHGGGVVCYVRNDLSYNILSVIPSEIERSFFEILLPNSKPKMKHENYENYILGDFNINLYSCFLGKKNILSSKSIPNDIKSYHEFCTFFGLKQLTKVPTRISCLTITDHILGSYPERANQRGVLDIGTPKEPINVEF